MFAFNGDYRMQCCISFWRLKLFRLLPVALDSAERRMLWRLGDVASGEHCAVLTNPVPQLALANAVCVFSHAFLAICISALFLRIAPGWKFDWRQHPPWLEITACSREFDLAVALW